MLCVLLVVCSLAHQKGRLEQLRLFLHETPLGVPVKEMGTLVTFGKAVHNH